MIDSVPPELSSLQNSILQVFSNAKFEEESSDPALCREIVKQLGQQRLLNFERDAFAVRRLCLSRYWIAQRSALSDLLYAMQGLGSYPIRLAGTEAQRDRYLRGVQQGELIAAFAITEPEAGSDVRAMNLRAEKIRNGYVLNGKKTLISNAGLADFYTLFARTGEDSGHITAFILDGKNPGLRTTPIELIAAHPIGQLELTDCHIPEEQRLGQEGEGLKIAYATLDVFRSSVGAAAIGMAERAFQEAVRYAKTRKQFGRALSEFQAVQFKLAEMMQSLQASKLLIWDAAAKKDAGAERITLESALAKSFATEAAQQIIDQALQIHGGIGLIKGSVTERLYRDIRALRIYEGATEILKSVIAAQILKD
jgi:acyl-CoA dehydrogenase